MIDPEAIPALFIKISNFLFLENIFSICFFKLISSVKSDSIIVTFFEYAFI